MKLKGKFIFAIVAVLSISYGLLMFYTSILQNKLIIGQAEKQARMIHKQILYTRQWVADHDGLFLMQSENTLPNPLLNNPSVVTHNGLVLVKRNPAMVTRELSKYASQAGYYWFRVTSIKPINPGNKPDAFEEKSLHSFNKGISEQLAITQGPSGKILRLAVPLLVKQSCLGCHAEHGYKVGDIRGALSVSVPIAWAETYITQNNRSILIYGILSILVLVSVMYFLFNTLVSQPLEKLTKAMESFPEKSVNEMDLPNGNNEIGNLSKEFKQLCHRLESSREALESASEKGVRAEKLAALGQLTAGIAHEINNPLGGMLNCLQSMQKDPDNHDLQKRYLPLLEKGLRRIENTMRQLLNYGRNEPLKIHRVDINNVILDCLELLNYRLRKVVVNLDLRLTGEHCIDNEAVKQIVMNIVLNAIQAMEHGGCLTIGSFKHNNSVVLQVEDTGTGIARKDLDRIFDPFYTTKEVGEGTGLGLAVTLSLVQRLDGNIEVESIPGKGSIFTITLPINMQCFTDETEE